MGCFLRCPSSVCRKFEKHAPHSRYFSDELGALFIYNNIEHMFTCLVTYGIIFIWKVKCNTKFQNARVNSICLEFSLAYIFALLIATPIALYNVHAADCLPVQIGVTNEKTRRSETFNI